MKEYVKIQMQPLARLQKIKSNIESEIKLAILKRATELKKKTDAVTREKNKNKTLGGENKKY